MLVIFNCEFIVCLKLVGVLWALGGHWGSSPTDSICFSTSASTRSTTDLGLLHLTLNEGPKDCPFPIWAGLSFSFSAMEGNLLSCLLPQPCQPLVPCPGWGILGDIPYLLSDQPHLK